MTNRRANGEGSIYRLPNGKWKVAISLGFNADGTRIRKTATAATKREAAICLAELKERYASISIEARNYTVQSWCDEWLLKVAPSNAAPHTVGGYRSNLERHVYPRLGHIGLVDLNGKTVAVAEMPEASTFDPLVDRVRVLVLATDEPLRLRLTNLCASLDAELLAVQKAHSAVVT